MRFRMLAAVMSWMLALVAVPCFAQQPVAPDTSIAPVGTPRPVRTEPAPRTGWMFGIGGGYGIAGPHAVGSPDHEPGGTMHLRFGAGVSPHAVVGVEYLTWSATPTDSTTWDLTAAGPSLTWYWGSNLYVRGMVGWAMGESQFEVGTPPGHTLVSIHDDGFAFLGSVGWEWRYRRRLAIAPEVEYLYLGMTKETKYSLASGSLSFNWYF